MIVSTFRIITHVFPTIPIYFKQKYFLVLILVSGGDSYGKQKPKKNPGSCKEHLV